MKQPVRIAVVGAIGGLVIGYLIFANVAGMRIPVGDLIPVIGGGMRGGMRRLAQGAFGIGEIRRSILLSGAAGAGIALLVASFFGRGRR